MAVFSCSFLLKYAAIAAFQNACFSSRVIAWNTLYFIGSVLSVPLLHSYYTIWRVIYQFAKCTNITCYIHSFCIWHVILKCDKLLLIGSDFLAITEAQKRATANYQKKLSSISIRIKPEQAEQIKKHAERKGLSLRAYILGLIEKDMQEAEGPKK